MNIAHDHKPTVNVRALRATISGENVSDDVHLIANDYSDVLEFDGHKNFEYLEDFESPDEPEESEEPQELVEEKYTACRG